MNSISVSNSKPKKSQTPSVFSFSSDSFKRKSSSKNFEILHSFPTQFNSSRVLSNSSIFGFGKINRKRNNNKKKYAKEPLFHLSGVQSNYSLDSEKLTFQNYWKTSNLQKIQTLLVTFSQNKFSQNSGKNVAKLAFFKSESSFDCLPYAFKQKEQYSSHFERLFPESDYFVSSNSEFKFFQNFQFGNFFPRKKFFQQYWIFPLLGFVFFFSSNFSFFESSFDKPLKKKKLFPQIFFVHPVFSFSQSEKKTFPVFSLPQVEGFTLPFVKNQTGAKPELFSNGKPEISQTVETKNFCYSNKRNNLWYTTMKQYEANEFKTFFETYRDIIDSKFFTSLVFDDKLSFTPFFSIPIEFQNQYRQKNQNVFSWVWFQTQIPFQSSFFENTKDSNFNGWFLNTTPKPLFELPKKAEFFNFAEKQEDFVNPRSHFVPISKAINSFRNQKKKNKFENSTPLFQFLKYQSFFESLDKSVNFSLSENFLNSELFDFLFEKQIRRNTVSDNLFFQNSKNSANFFYLKKWFENQKFFHPHFQFSFTSLPLCFLDNQQSMKNGDKFQNTQIFHFLSSLDSIYMQKTLCVPNTKKTTFDFSAEFFTQFPDKSLQEIQFKKYTQKRKLFKLPFLQYYLEKLKDCNSSQQNQFFQSNVELLSPEISTHNIRLFDFLLAPNQTQKKQFIKKLQLPLLLHFSSSSKNLSKKTMKIQDSKKKEVLAFKTSELLPISKNFFSFQGFKQQLSFFQSEKEKIFVQPVFSLKKNKTDKNTFFENWFHQKKFYETSYFRKSFVSERKKTESVKFFKISKNFIFENLRQNKEFIEKKEFHENETKSLLRLTKSYKIQAKQEMKFFGENEHQSSFQNQQPKSFLFQNRKFEKIFQTFFSPFSFQTTFPEKKQKVFLLKTQIDKIFLERFYNSSSFFSSFPDVMVISPQSTLYLPPFFSSKPLEKHPFLEKTPPYNLITPTFLLKREGFLQFFLAPKQTVEQVSKTEFSSEVQKNFSNFETFKRLQNEKASQKKRRLKKQKLETRRRKKRKRFYPRPTWLRFQLYKKFLQVRHSQKTPTKKFLRQEKDLNFQKSRDLANYEKNFVFRFQKSLNLTKFLKVSNFHFQKILFQKNNYQNFCTWKQLPKKRYLVSTFFFENQLTKKVFQSNLMSQNIEYYKLSSELLSDFLRFSWKSSWFQQNYQVYKNNLMQNFAQMKAIEKQKIFSNFFLSNSKNFKDHNFSTFTSLREIQDSVEAQTALEKKFMWYFNIQNSYHVSEIEKNIFSFLQLQKNSEYQRILYNRLEEILKTLKFSENSEEIFSKSFKISSYSPLEKGEVNSSNVSVFTKFALFFENFHIPSQPTIPTFSLFSNIFQNFSEKVPGEGPTIRALWAFQKTNFSHFQETNLFRSFWTKRKKLESLKSFKGMKNILRFLESSSNIEKIQTPQLFFEPNSFLFLREKFQPSMHPEQNELAAKVFQVKSHNFFEQLDRVTLQKFLAIQKKCSFYGIHSLQQNSKLSLRYLKYRLLSSNIRKTTSFSNFEKTKGTSKSFQKISNQQNSSLSSLNFWWNQKYPQIENFLVQASDKPIEEFFEIPLFSLFHQQKFENTQEIFFFQTQFLFVGTFLFHIALFLTFLKLPQIRSLLKFQFLIFSKLFSTTSVLVFLVANFLQDLSQQGKTLFFIVSDNHFSNQFFSQQFFSKKLYLQNQPISYFQSEKLANQNKLKNENQSFFFEFFVRVSSFSTTNNIRNFFPMFSDFQKPWRSFFSSTFPINFEENQSFDSRQFFLRSFQQRNMRSFQIFQLISPTTQKKFSISQSLSFRFAKFLRFSDIPRNDFRVPKKRKPFFFSPLSFWINESLSDTSQKVEIFKERQSIFLSQISLFFLKVTKRSLQGSSKAFFFGLKVSGKFFDLFEFFFLNLYKFLEKPAELIIEWIAVVFLIEWAADIASFLPESYDNFFWKSSKKLFRPIQAGNLTMTSFQFFSFSGGQFQFFPVFFGFHYIMISSFFLKNTFSSIFENFLALSLQPDIDILTRQRKGMIFWDIWAEILLKAAEKYNVNIPSFVTLKEEQEVFLEQLIQDPKFLESLSSSTFDQNFSIFTETFFPPGRPKKLFDSQFFQHKTLPIAFQQQQNQEKIQKLSFLSFFFSFPFAINNNSSRFQFFEEKNRQTNQTRNDIHNIPKQVFQISKNSVNLSSIFFVNFLQNPNDSISEILHQIQDRWSCTQYGISQGSETDLFIDIHPPKSFQHIKFFQYYDPAQFLIGSLMCQLSSGLFPQQISKNILVIGELGTAKTLFLQALAGESEMKILTDNAYRYATVQKGVAVGMKYLRDVFDSIALQTPCFFVMEHIHVIGSKRPFLISDEDNLKDSFFSAEQQEVHESNQLIYQLTRHSLTDFKRPYKGDFSMGISSNFFLQDFYSQFPKYETQIFKNSLFSGSWNENSRSFLHSPLPLSSIENSLQNENSQSSKLFETHTREDSIQSFLQLSKEQIFAPPATSPFTVLMLKEQKKLKPFQTVQEFSWGGFAPDQILSYQKESFSVRSKVAILADMTMNLSRGKLDMITDLLVIIDSVRANHGFIVFATTHLPAILDPALRRPGRFDETLSLAQSPNFFNRFELLKMHLQSSISTLDFFDASLLTENSSEFDLFYFINMTKLSFFHSYKLFLPNQLSVFQTPNQKISKRIFSQKNPKVAFFDFLKSPIFANFYTKEKAKKNSFLQSQKNFQQSFSQIKSKETEKMLLASFPFTYGNRKGSAISFLRSLAYSKIGTFLYQSQALGQFSAFSSVGFDINNLNFSKKNLKNYLAILLYNSQEDQKMQLTLFLAAKILDFFSEKNLLFYSSKTYFGYNEKLQKEKLQKSSSFYSFYSKGTRETSLKTEKTKNSSTIFLRKFAFFSSSSSFEKTQSQLYSQTQNLQFLKKKTFWTTFGTDNSWRFATPFLIALLQKRFFFTKNLLLSKLLFFENKNQQKQAPSPPNSSIFMPSKKYENFKRIEFDFSQKPFFSMNQKIQFHQKQRFLKQLYNVPFQRTFLSQRFKRSGSKKTSFTTSFSELAYFESSLDRMSSTHFYQRKYFTVRHNFSHINLWWNGMFPEHNSETTYLSDVDWRTMFVSQQNSKNTKFETIEFTMDFPDSEQYYNPRNRRWFLSKFQKQNIVNQPSFLLDFDLDLQYEIYYHFFMESFHANFKYFDKKREVVDFFVFDLFQKTIFQEFESLSIFTRFYLL
jgi:SpoVK/Ycf46/Vps4 family AAA+-type ATPase